MSFPASQAYLAVRHDVLQLLTETGASGDEPVPACAGWTVRDLLAHLVGLAASWVDGDLEVYASPQWTASHVATWSDREIVELAAAWQELGDRLAAHLDDLEAASHLPQVITTINGPAPLSTFSTAVVIDALLHQGDLASALGVESAAGPYHADLTKVLVRSASLPWRRFGHEPVRVISLEHGVLGQLGVDEPTCSVAGTTVDLFRSLGGRRTLDQLRELSWEPTAPTNVGDLVVPFFRPPGEPVEPGPTPTHR